MRFRRWMLRFAGLACAVEAARGGGAAPVFAMDGQFDGPGYEIASSGMKIGMKMWHP